MAPSRLRWARRPNGYELLEGRAIIENPDVEFEFYEVEKHHVVLGDVERLDLTPEGCLAFANRWGPLGVGRTARALARGEEVVMPEDFNSSGALSYLTSDGKLLAFCNPERVADWRKALRPLRLSLQIWRALDNETPSEIEKLFARSIPKDCDPDGLFGDDARRAAARRESIPLFYMGEGLTWSIYLFPKSGLTETGRLKKRALLEFGRDLVARLVSEARPNVGLEVLHGETGFSLRLGTRTLVDALWIELCRELASPDLRIKFCPACGAALEVSTRAHVPTIKFCGGACKQRAYRARQKTQKKARRRPSKGTL